MRPAPEHPEVKSVKLFDIWTSLQLILLWLAIGVTAWGLTAALPELRGTGLWWIGFFGVLLALLMARSRLPGWSSALLLPILGSLGLLLTVGRLGIPIRTLLTALVAPAGNHGAHTGGLVGAWGGIELAVSGLVTRFSAWGTALSAGRLTNDITINTLVWGLVLWLVAGWAAWWVARRKMAVAGLLPAAGLLCSLYFFNNLKSVALLAILGGTILLLEGVSGFSVVFRRWQKNRLDQAEDVTPETALNLLGVAVCLMAVGWILTSIPVEKINDNIRKFLDARRNGYSSQSIVREQLNSTPFIFQHSFPSLTTVSFQVEGYPRLTNEVVMYVSVDGYQPGLDIAQDNSQTQFIPQPYYWRTLTFDDYEMDGWHNSINASSDYTPGVAVPPGPAEASRTRYQLVRQHVKLAGNLGGLVAAAGQMVSLDQPYYVYWRSPQDLISAQTDAVDYTAESRLPTVTADQLRQAGTNYPAFLNKYLQYPDELPLRVRSLAFDLTATQPTRYDQVLAIQTYLRSFPYTLDVPAPPQGRDITDFFLFDLKKGYCDYYATAMAVMARVIGIPSRMVTGFSTGKYNEQTGSFVVTANNAHAWVELYFPGAGWVEFEPTAGSPAIGPPGRTETVSQATPAPLSYVEKGANASNGSFLTKLYRGKSALAFAALLVILLFTLFFSAERLILLLSPTGWVVTNIYRRLYRLGGRWFSENTRAHTPNEFSSELSAHLLEQYEKGHLFPTLIATRTGLAWLTDLYNRSLYSSGSPTRLEHRQAVHTWFLLRRNLSWLRIEKTIPFLKRTRRLR